jgi:hypothetical protein
LCTYDAFDGGDDVPIIGSGFVSKGCNRDPGVSDCAALVDVTSFEWTRVVFELLF